MKITSILVSLFAILPLAGWPMTASEARQIADIDFEDGTATDRLGNVTVELLNEAEIVSDDNRNGKVATFVADKKGCLKLGGNVLSDEMTFSFFGRREDADPSANWRMFLALYGDDGSAIYLTPKTTWSNYSYLVLDNKPYSTYRSLAGNTINNNQWYHFAIVFSQNRIKYYVDGVLGGELATLLNLSDSHITKIFMGCNPELNYPMTGRVDNIKIYHSALSANQIAALAKEKDLPDPIEITNVEEAPYARFSFENGYTDDMKTVTSSTEGLLLQSDNLRGQVLNVTTAGNLTVTDDLLGAESSVGFAYRGESFDDNSVGKVIMQIKGDAENADNVSLVVSKVSAGNAIVELKVKQGDTERTTGALTSKPLYAGQWNGIVITQLFSSGGTPYYRLYINGTLAKQVIGYSNAENQMTNFAWGVGENTCPGLVDEITMYKRTLTAAEVQTWNAEYCEYTNITLMANLRHQTMRNFGASDGWNTHFIGKYFPEQKKERLAELLFSCETYDDGTPKGIGLTSWRFNIGAGTTEQGAASRIGDETRRTECFLNPDMTTYDWSKQIGQQWFLEKAAKTYNVPDIIGWQNVPPVYFNKNNLGFRDYGEPKSTILQREHFSDFGKFLADVVNHFKAEGINFKYVSPLNEPQWDWCASAEGGTVNQEGSPWLNTEVSDVVKAIDAQFVANNVDTKLFIGEAGSIVHLLSESSGNYQNQLYNFWSSESPLYVADLPSMSNIVSSHSYWTDGNANDIVDKRANLKAEMNALDETLEYWQTEYSLLGNGYKAIHSNGSSRTLSPMESGISLARIVHNDLVQADCSGWQWWTTFERDASSGNEERFALIRYILNADRTDGVFGATKLLYSLGNFSRFIRPGMKRIDVERSDNMSDVDAVANQMFSAFVDDSTGDVVIVAVNASQHTKAISIDVEGLDSNIAHYIPYVTTNAENDNLKRYPEIAPGDIFTLPATSIITFVGKSTGESSVENIVTAAKSKVVKVYPNPATDFVSVGSVAAISRVALYDMGGRMVYVATPGQNEVTVSLDGLNKGVYVLKVESADSNEVHKLIVK